MPIAVARLASKRRFPLYLPSCALAWWASCCGKASGAASRSIPASSRPGPRSCEEGFLLVALVPLLLLLTAFFAGSLEVALRAQARAALQARLDVCAVKIAVMRERLLDRVVAMNKPLDLTVKAITALRAGSAIPIVGEFAAASEEVLVVVNEGLAAAENGLVVAAGVREALALPCRSDPYSREFAFCLVSPTLASALEREDTFFSDIKGHLKAKDGNKDLASVTCRGGGLVTKLVLKGDPSLMDKGFDDEYEK